MRKAEKRYTSPSSASVQWRLWCTEVTGGSGGGTSRGTRGELAMISRRLSATGRSLRSIDLMPGSA